MTLRTASIDGPSVFVLAMRARYAFVSATEVSVPASSRDSSSDAVAVSSEKPRSGGVPTTSSSSLPGEQPPRDANGLGGSVAAQRYRLGSITDTGRRACVACSYAYPNASSAASVYLVPLNEMFTGRRVVAA